MSFKKSLIFFSLLFLLTSVQGQEKMVIEGAIQIGDVENDPPAPGTIRWTGLNFEGWNGFNWVSLTSFVISELIFDVDSNQYPIVQIGNQEWMAQNLRTSKYSNGQDVNQNFQIWTGEIGQYTWYVSDSSTYEEPYGKLYNWYAVTDSQGLCPSGWHVPNDSEWDQLIIFLGGSSEAGGPLKEAGNEHWLCPNTGATNHTGFTALPGGARSNGGTFFGITSGCFFWSASESTIITAPAKTLGSNSASIGPNIYNKNYGLSVRCLKD